MGLLNLLKVLWTVPCIFVVSSPADQKTITAESGQNVTLPCRAQNNNITIIVIDWSRADLERESVLLYRDERLDPEQQHESFKNRVDLQDHQMKDGDVSVILKDVTAADEGTYECRVIQRRTNRMKRAILKTAPISTIYLVVVGPPGSGGGAVGLIVGLSVVGLSVAALVVAAAVGFLIYRKHKQQSPGSVQPSDEEQSYLQMNIESPAAPAGKDG